tara:strand:- start:1148 stop:1459 length:312 start_codon:yes stop_codon:yes gene_type:complete
LSFIDLASSVKKYLREAVAIKLIIFLSNIAAKDYTAKMSGFLAPLMIFAMIATVGVLFFGIYTMARGGEFNRKHSNKIMRARIVMQGVALLLFAVVMVIAGKS